MMPSSSTTKCVDLSRLTDDEAKHVWQVIQRDFNLRKKEEDRLGELKTKIMKEDNKRELLEYQPKLSDSLCIRCLQPFKFLVNSKRMCLDCKLHVCKSCSRFNKKDRGWVCDPCHMARILKIGTLEWFHENERSRFKGFGSSKVMNSLFRRLNNDRFCSQIDIRAPRDDDTHSMPEVHTDDESAQVLQTSSSLLTSFEMEASGQHLATENARSLYSPDIDESEEGNMHHSNMRRKSRRLLSVDPLDFNIGAEKAAFTQSTLLQDPDTQVKITLTKDSENDAEWFTTCKQILENGTNGEETKDLLHISQRSLDKPSQIDECTPHLNQRMAKSHSLSKMSLSSAGSTSYHLHRELFYSQDNSEEDDDSEMNVVYSPSLHRESSPEEVPPQIVELNMRMSAIETILTRLEQKMTLPVIGSVEEVEPNEKDLSPADLEEMELRKKLDELTERISDKGLSSEEEDTIQPPEDSPKKEAIYQMSPLRRASTPLGDFRQEWPLDVEWKSNMTANKYLRKQRRVSSFDFSGTTSCELSQLEGKVAMAVASVQSTQSGVTDIQKRIAALGAAGMSVDGPRRQDSQPARMLHEFPTRGHSEARSMQKQMTM